LFAHRCSFNEVSAARPRGASVLLLFTLKKLECSKQGNVTSDARREPSGVDGIAFNLLNSSAWDNRTGPKLFLILLVLRRRNILAWVMINRDSWGSWYLTARGEILGFVNDQLLRKH
jgi:hypothetical protein